MTDYGDLYVRLDQLRSLVDARWVALAWRNEDGEWQQHLRGRENPLPQVQRRFFAQLESIDLSSEAESTRARWQEFTRTWHAETGFFDAFAASGGNEAYYAVLDPNRADVQGWVDLTLRAIADAAVDFQRAHLGITRQQAVLESAASMLTAASEDDVIPRGLGLAMRLVDASGAAFYHYDESQQRFMPAFVRADGRLHDALREYPHRHANLCADVMRTRKIQRQNISRPSGKSAGMIRSIVGVPMLAHDGLQGILLLAGTGERDFDELDLNTLTLFARQLAGVLENLRLLRKLRIANQELSQTQAQLVESARLSTLAEMAGGVAHDFNNILGALLGRVQLLQLRVTDANALSGLSKMERLISEGESTVKRLQEAARVRKNEPAGPQTIDRLARQVFHATELALNNQAQIDDRQLTWATDFQLAGVLEDTDGQLRGSLRRILTELSKQAPVGSQITVSTDRDHTSDFIRFSIVPPAGGDSTWQWDSLGEVENLKRIIAELGGHIDITPGSDNEPRCTIRFSPLPLEVSGDVTAESNSYRVLVVDDDSEVRDVLEELLRLDGHQVTSAVDGTQALELFAPEKYDFVFTDLGMPGISGWQVAESIKKHAPNMPVVMVTGWGAQLDPEKVKTSGVDRVLTKPFQWVAVRETLTELMTGRSEK